MARTTKRKADTTATTPTTPDTPTVLSPVSDKVQKLVTTLRQPFMAFAEGMSHLTTARSDLAPKFMKVFDVWQKETHGSFVDFVRALDASIPPDRDGYRAHPSYAAADYLRRLQTRSGQSRAPVPVGERPVTPLVALARLIATVLPVVDPSGSIWSAFVREMHWTENQADRLKVLAAREGAITLPPRTKHTLVQRAA